MVRYHDTLWCDGCGIEITWEPIEQDRLFFCCQNCFDGEKVYRPVVAIPVRAPDTAHKRTETTYENPSGILGSDGPIETD